MKANNFIIIPSCTWIKALGISGLWLVLLLAAGGSPPVGAATSETGNVCVHDYASGAICTAGDTTVTSIEVEDVIEPCTFIGDTGTITVRTVTDSTATTRYDLAWFIATDGGSALSGDACFHEHLHPVAAGTEPQDGDPDNPLGTGPFGQYDGDSCGDFLGNNNPTFVTDEITFTCIDDNTDGLVDPVSICTSYDNNDNTACNDISEAFPGTGSKCKCQELQIGDFEVPPFELAITKTGPDTAIPGETGTYTIEIENLGDKDGGADPIAYNSTFSDLIPIELRATSATVTAVSASDNGTCMITPDTVTFGNTVTCTLGNDAPNAPNGEMTESTGGDHKYTVTIEFVVDPNILEERTVDNEGCITAEDLSTPPVETEACHIHTMMTPVTLSFFQATRQGRGVSFDWRTVTESGNVGFNLYVENGPARERLNAELIPSQRSSSLKPLDYRFVVRDVTGDRFWIENIDVQGQRESHGPFSLNQPQGKRTAPRPIDWKSIRAEHASLKAARQARGPVTKALLASAKREKSQRMADSIAAASVQGTSPTVNLMINQTGLYRVTYEELHAAGFDLSSIPTDQLVLRNQGRPVPIWVYGKHMFGPGDAIEFYGEAVDTLYTDSNLYTLGLSPNPLRADIDTRRAKNGDPLSAYYLETVKIEKELEYSFIAPNGDPWHEHMFLARGGAASESYTIPIDNYAPTNAPVPTLSVGLWGLTSWDDVDDDHEVVLSLNGRQVSVERFDGTVDHPVSVSLLAADLQSGDNELDITVTGQAGGLWDMVALDHYGISYPRAYVARNNRLTFTAQAARFHVSGLAKKDIVVYRRQGVTLTRLEGVQVARDGNRYSATFAGLDQTATYLVSTVDALLKPAASETPLPSENIKTGNAQYLIIAHGNFIDGLKPLVQAREAQGLTVKTVDVAQTYHQFGSGVIDPLAIRNYIAYAVTHLGTESVLLAGGDCYDYRNYLGNGCVSLIPSLYDKTDPVADFAPVDPKYADINNDNVPDVAIGRFPVSTQQELEWMIQKTLAYEAGLGGSQQSAMFAADVGFGGISDALLTHMSGALSEQKVYLDNLEPTIAKPQLINSLNTGDLRYVSFVGHSGPRDWTYRGLFNENDAASLINETPMVVNQWGCWNTYYVDPEYKTLSHSFLVSGSHGAAAVLGSTAISYAHSERLLGDLLTPKLAQGMRMGAALTAAKQELAQQHPQMKDILLGWTILGDPNLKVVDPE